VPSFFIPGLSGDLAAVEQAYARMRAQTEVAMGRRPNARRIARLWMRRGSTDCITEVGGRDPMRGGTVMAIFDLGMHNPFVVWWQPDGMRESVRETLPCNAYSVLEFDP
jgi:hypothetical protein